MAATCIPILPDQATNTVMYKLELGQKLDMKNVPTQPGWQTYITCGEQLSFYVMPN